jgi:hypothetical protein
MLMFALPASFTYGQQIKGKVIDKDTKLPLNSAIITLGKKQTITNTFGEFSITGAADKDSLKINHTGYKTVVLYIISSTVEDIRIEMEPAKFVLKEVIIHANRESDYKKDSIENRTAYAKQFNYTGPKLMDAFVSNKPIKNTSELVSIDVITLIKVFTKKSTPEYKFHKVLLRDEQAEYVDQKFNRGIAAKVTDLKGDTLSRFLTRYRPTYQFAKKATDYEMINYIKDSCNKFKQDGFKGSDLFR